MSKLMILPGIVIGISFHEFAHAIVSYVLGDPTPKRQNRLTLNPLSHINPLGFVTLFLAGFGWGEPVRIDPTYYKHRRLDEMLVSLAGVVMNFIVAVICSFTVGIILKSNAAWLYGDMGDIIIQIMSGIISVNIVLMIFNLFPIPPLDGFGIITQIFNLRKYSWYYQIYDKGFFILLILVVFDVTDYVLTPAVNTVMGWLITTIIY